MSRVNINSVILSGNLTKDPELTYLPSGTAKVRLRIANHRRYKDSSGEQKEETNFITVIAWGRQAETCGKYLLKGREVLIEGRISQRSWETQEGQKRSMVEINTRRVHFVGFGGQTKTEQKPADNSEIEIPEEPTREEEIPF